MVYREAALTDCEKVYSLICELEGRKLPFEKFQKIYCEQINSERYYCLLGEQDNDVLAVLNLRFEEQLHHAECIAEILEFVVDPDYRGLGIGKQMLERAVQIAEANGCTQIEVACNQLRSDSHRFYLREDMNNSHFKFSKRINTDTVQGNIQDEIR